MKYKLNYLADDTGTCYQDEIEVSYDTLVEVFGEPDPIANDGYKTDIEWLIEFEDGTIATIYNWKNGHNYLGEHDGLSIENITYWHIGGFDKKAADYIKDAIHRHEEVE